jgi:uncharacterized protein YbjT (DUF2867 family)
MENILVAGANGTTGKKIVALLEKSQYFKPIAMIREKEQEEKFAKRNIKTVVADLEEDISHVLKNIDKIIFAAGSGGKSVKKVDENGAKKLINWAEKENINKFVMLSSMGAEQPEEAEALKAYLRAKHNADEFLKESSLTYSIIRPGTLTNNKGAGRIELKSKLNKRGEISRDDVAQTLVRVLHDSAAVNQTFEIIEGDTLIGKAIPN